MIAGHDPFVGSLAPTPTVSDAPMATYRTPGLAFAAAVGLTVAVAVADAVLREAVGPRVDEGWAAGAGEHAPANAAQITVRTARSRFHIKAARPVGFASAGAGAPGPVAERASDLHELTANHASLRSANGGPCPFARRE